MSIRSFRILNMVTLAALLLGGGGCKPGANSGASSANEDKPSMDGGDTLTREKSESRTSATDDTQYMTLTNSRDGTRFRVAIPAEPAGDFGSPNYSGDLDEDVGLSGYSSGVEAIKKLATDASGGADAHDIFLAIMADHSGNRNGADAGYTDSGALLLTVWYQCEHLGVKFVDAAEALKQNPPDIRKIKKAAHVASMWIEAFNTGNYNYGAASGGSSVYDASQSAVTHDTPANASQAPRDAQTHTRRAQAHDTAEYAPTPANSDREYHATKAQQKAIDANCLAAGLEKDCDGL